MKIRMSFSKDILIFLFFVAMAACLFFLVSLSKSYERELDLAVVYTDMPKNYAFTQSLPASISVRIKDTGFNFLASKIKHSDDTIYFSLKNRFNKGKDAFVIPTKELKDSIEKCYDIDAVILSFIPQNLIAKYETLASKKLPVQLIKKISFAEQYILKKEISVTPSDIEVFGAKSILDTMTVVCTEAIILNDLSETKTVNAKLKLNNVTSTVNEVKVNIPVEQFTEKTIDIPVMGRNFPQEIKLRTFPVSVKVSFFVGLSHFNNITADDILLYLDYNDLMNNRGSSSIVKISTENPFISNIRLSPDMVEYILETEPKKRR